MKTVIEPFRIKSVEAIRMTTKEERERIVQDAAYNLFSVASQNVVIDARQVMFRQILVNLCNQFCIMGTIFIQPKYDR